MHNYDADEPEHTHEFVEGKCECGESDPDWVEPKPEQKDEVALSFDEMPANMTYAECAPEIVVDPLDGENKALVVPGDGVTKRIYFSIAADKDDYDVAVAEFKMLWSEVNNVVAEFMLISSAEDKASYVSHNYFSNGNLYIYPNNSETLLGHGDIWTGKWFTLRMEYRVVEKDGAVVPELTYKINGEVIGVDNGLAGTGYYADGVLDSSKIPTPSELTMLRVQVSSSVRSGSIYLDDVVFMHNYDADEPEHTHEFVEGKCECGESDPTYVPEHTHNFVEGKCECGESDPNYVAPSTDPEADSTLTIEQAIALGASKEHNTYTEGKYYVTGVITEVYNTQYGNMKIKDEAGNIFTIYGTYSADGAKRYDALDVKPVAGDTVTVYGIIGQFNGTAQIKNGWIVEHTAHECVMGDATCSAPAACTICGKTEGATLDHNYGEDDKCTVCGTLNPAHVHEYVSGTCVCGAKEVVAGDPVTVSKAMSDFGWADATKKTSFALDDNI